MHAKGHAGMALLITFGVLSLFRLTSTEFIIAALLTTAFAALPDIDIRFKIGHRKYTHNILAAIILGLILAFIFYPIGWHIGFISGFSAIMIHILGDLFTKMEFAPLWPFYKKKVSLKWIKSNNPIVNEVFAVLGTLMLFIHFLFIYTDAGYVLLDNIL